MADPGLSVESVQRRAEMVDWGALPSDVLEQALAMLPLREVFRLRCVCKRWNGLIHCGKFQKRTLRSGLPWGPFHSPRVEWNGVGSPARPWSAYDLSLSMENPTMGKTTMPQLEFPECARNARWTLIAAGGGLLCFGCGIALGDPRRILVCNPMTKAWRELPNLSGIVSFDDRIRWLTIVVKECGSSYKILFAGNSAVDVYDSVTNKYCKVEAPSSEMSFPDVTCGSGAYLNGKMYLLGKLVRKGPKVVMILDPATLRWREDTIPMPTTSLEYPFIVGWSGEVFLVGGVFERPVESILLFRLDAGGKWTKVSEYSNHAFLKEWGGIYGCGAYRGRIFLLSREFMSWVVVYNCVTGVWVEEPFEDSFYSKMETYGTKFAFQPNLVAVP